MPTHLPPFDLQPLSNYWVWFEVLTEEVLALPCKEATPQLLAQLKKEGVEPKEVLARNARDARRLGCPDYFKKPIFSSSSLFSTGLDLNSDEFTSDAFKSSNNKPPKFH